MSTERGVVEKTENGFAWVRTQKKSACTGCASRSHCSGIVGGNQMLVKVTNPIQAQKGDSVELYLSTSFQLKCTFIIYMIPVFGLITGALLAAPMSNLLMLGHSIGIAVFTISGLLVSVYFSRVLINKISREENINPIIRRMFSHGN